MGVYNIVEKKVGRCHMCECEDKTKVRTPEEKKNLIHRLNRISGQVKGITKMIEDNRYCKDILIQLSAIDKSIKSLANVILDDHMHSCLIENIEKKNYQVVDEIVDLFKRFQ